MKRKWMLLVCVIYLTVGVWSLPVPEGQNDDSVKPSVNSTVNKTVSDSKGKQISTETADMITNGNLKNASEGKVNSSATVDSKIANSTAQSSGGIRTVKTSERNGGSESSGESQVSPAAVEQNGKSQEEKNQSVSSGTPKNVSVTQEDGVKIEPPAEPKQSEATLTVDDGKTNENKDIIPVAPKVENNTNVETKSANVTIAQNTAVLAPSNTLDQDKTNLSDEKGTSLQNKENTNPPLRKEASSLQNEKINTLAQNEVSKSPIQSGETNSQDEETKPSSESGDTNSLPQNENTSLASQIEDKISPIPNDKKTNPSTQIEGTSSPPDIEGTKSPPDTQEPNLPSRNEETNPIKDEEKEQTEDGKTGPPVDDSDDEFSIGTGQSSSMSETIDYEGSYPDDDDYGNKDAHNSNNKGGSALQPEIQHPEQFTDDADSHFFAYFLTIMVTAIIFYLVFHNKQRIIALIIEGRAPRNGRTRRSSSKAKYHKLDNNFEEAITATKGTKKH